MSSPGIVRKLLWKAQPIITSSCLNGISETSKYRSAEKKKKNTLNLKCNLSLYTILASQSPLLKKNYIKDQGPMFSQYGPEQAKLGYLIIRKCFTSPIVRK